MPHAPSYVMSKHGVVGLTKTDVLDYASRGIRVSAVCPGFVRTNLTDSKSWERLRLFLYHLAFKFDHRNNLPDVEFCSSHHYVQPPR